MRFAALLLAVGLAGCGPRTRGPSEWRREPPWGLDADAAAMWRKALGAGARSGSIAVLVSRRQYATLRGVSGWHSMAVLSEYVRWADRPEPAHWEDGWLTADLGPHDLVLVRWPAERVRADVEVKRDAIGFAVLDLGVGRKRVRVELMPAMLPAEWLSHLRLTPDAEVRAAVDRGKGIAEVYGAHLSGWPVTDGSKPLTVLYQGDSQVNVKLDGAKRVCIESSCAEVQR